MAGGTSARTRCGIDTVEIARVERLLLGTPQEDLLRIFSEEELRDVGEGPGSTARLAARFAAKEACLKLFPREAALGLIDSSDFALARDGYGAPRVVCSPRALALIARHGLTAIAVSLAHDKTSASAVAVAEPASPCRMSRLVSSYTTGGFVHLLLIIAAIVVVLQLTGGRRAD